MSQDCCNDLTLSVNSLQVTWVYDHLSRHYKFTCYVFKNKWQQLPDSSYVTNMPDGTTTATLINASRRILTILENKGIGYFTDVFSSSYKDDLELISWMSPEHIESEDNSDSYR